MKLLHRLLGLALGAGLGLLIGLGVRVVTTPGRASSPDARAGRSIASADSPPRDVLAVKQRMVTRTRDDSPLTTQLARELSLSSRVTRWLYWLETLEKASLADFPRLASLANGDATATRLVASRWVELDLQNLFDTLCAVSDRRALPVDELAGVLFLEWARRDPDAAVAALQGTNNLGTRETWRFHVAGYLVEKDPERGLRALSAWGIDNFAPRMAGVAQWAAADPRHAAEAVLAHPAGYTSELAIETVGKEWAKTDPSAAMEFASARPGPLATALASTVLISWAGRNSEQAAHWLARADLITRQRLSPAFVESWAKNDTTGALVWCEANLAGSSLAQTVGSAVNGAAAKNVTAAAAFVAGMKPSPARAEAAAAVAKYWFPGWRSGKPVPAPALAWMAGLDAASAKRALDQVQWKWSNGDVKSMAEFVATAGSDKVSASADRSVARALARQNPQKAFAWARRLPEDRARTAGREVFAEWRQAQPEPAMKWLNDLPPADPRREFFLQHVE
jgi:hypothetical protein